MSEKAFLRGVVPAVAAPGHGLDEILIPEPVDEGVARVMAALVTVDNRFVVQGAAVFSDEVIYSLQDEIHLKALADAIGQNFVGVGIEERGEITLSFLSVEQISDVRQQNLSCSTFEFPVDHIAYLWPSADKDSVSESGRTGRTCASTCGSSSHSG